jgi:hypothetical protein
MPLYEYHCPHNDRVIEVVHRMTERFETWGELCAHARIEAGDTPADAPVKRLISGGTANNLNNTVSKRNAMHGENSKQLRHGPMAAPLRSNKF